MKNTAKNSLLSDHKREGKVFSPPFNQIQNLQPNNWVDDFIPEVIWIAMLHKVLGYKEGTKLVAALAKASHKHFESHNILSPALLTNHLALSQREKDEIFYSLQKDGVIVEFTASLMWFHNLFPNNPLHYLSNNVTEQPSSQDIKNYKNLLERLLDRRSTESVFSAANVMYVQSLLYKFVFEQGSVMTDFPRIQEYPDSEISRMIASVIRASVKIFNSPPHKFSNSTWKCYFWQNGYEYEPSRV